MSKPTDAPPDLLPCPCGAAGNFWFNDGLTEKCRVRCMNASHDLQTPLCANRVEAAAKWNTRASFAAAGHGGDLVRALVGGEALATSVDNERALAFRVVTLERERDALRAYSVFAPNSCSVCGGAPLASGRECICGGKGTTHAEMDGLRQALFDAENRATTTPSPAPDAHDEKCADLYCAICATEKSNEL